MADKATFNVRVQHNGGPHARVTVFAGLGDGTRGNCGTLVMARDEAEAFRKALEPVSAASWTVSVDLPDTVPATGTDPTLTGTMQAILARWDTEDAGQHAEPVNSCRWCGRPVGERRCDCAGTRYSHLVALGDDAEVEQAECAGSASDAAQEAYESWGPGW